MILDSPLPFKKKEREKSLFVLAQNFRKIQWTQKEKNVYHLKKKKKLLTAGAVWWLSNKSKPRNERLENTKRLSKPSSEQAFLRNMK